MTRFRWCHNTHIIDIAVLNLGCPGCVTILTLQLLQYSTILAVTRFRWCHNTHIRDISVLNNLGCPGCVTILTLQLLQYSTILAVTRFRWCHNTHIIDMQYLTILAVQVVSQYSHYRYCSTIPMTQKRNVKILILLFILLPFID